MDFIERWFGLSPDNGDGSYELLLIVAAVTSLAVVVFRRRLRALVVRMLSGHRHGG